MSLLRQLPLLLQLVHHRQTCTQLSLLVMILAVLDGLGRGLDDRADCDCNDVVSRKWEEEE